MKLVRIVKRTFDENLHKQNHKNCNEIMENWEKIGVEFFHQTTANDRAINCPDARPEVSLKVESL